MSIGLTLTLYNGDRARVKLSIKNFINFERIVLYQVFLHFFPKIIISIRIGKVRLKTDKRNIRRLSTKINRL